MQSLVGSLQSGEACATSIILSVYLGYHVQPTYFTQKPKKKEEEEEEEVTIPSFAVFEKALVFENNTFLFDLSFPPF